MSGAAESGGKGPVDVFQAFIESRLADVHTSIPGKFISYDEKTGLAKVQPTVRLKRKINDEIITIDIPPIDNAPVLMLSTSSFILEFPIKKGDGCAIFFSEVGIGNFINGCQDMVDPDDLSRFSLTDAFIVPGLWCKNKKPSGTPTIKLTDAGILELKGASQAFTRGDDLETLLNTFLNSSWLSLPAGTVVQNAAILTALQAAGNTAKALVTSIKSTTIKGE